MIQTGKKYGMTLLDDSIMDLFKTRRHQPPKRRMPNPTTRRVSGRC